MKKIYLLTTGLSFAIAVAAQSPGGVGTGLSLWLRADASGTLSSTDSLNSWTYFNNSLFSFSSAANHRPIVQTNSINFLPSVFFNGAQQMDGPNGSNAPITSGNPGYAIIAVWSSNFSGTPGQRVWSQRDTAQLAASGNGGGLWIYNGQYGDQDEISPYTQGVGLTENVQTPYISEVNLLAQNTSDLQLVDQTNIGGSPVVLNSDPAGMALTHRNISTVINRLGSRDSASDEPFTGNLAELIVYNNEVDNTSPVASARNRIFSYLSMKYGIPLQAGSSLLSSAGDTVWNAIKNSGYNNDLFGLAVDNTSGLNVQQSNPSTTGNSGTGISGAGNIVVTPYDALTADQSFLIIGDDGQQLVESAFDMPAGYGSERFKRNWWVQNTGSVGRVNVNFDFTGLQSSISGTVGTTTDFRLIVSKADPTFFSGPIGTYTPVSFTGNVANFVGVSLPDSSVFTIITDASAGTPLPVNFISFTARPNGGNVDLNWVVGNNQEASSYEVERSPDGVNFTQVGVLANNADQTNYSFVDADPGSGTHYYRVLETDEDGKSIYSKVISAAIGAGDFSVAVLNNPAVGKTDAQLQITAPGAGVAYIELWSVGGARISLQQEAIGTGTTTISVPMSSLAPGTYVVKVMVNNNVHVAQVVKM
ncbi:MAG TPA: T9SS type A sorting domain-containing protein [Puia sp.]|nr:T9SS type A sorting domain-containing protein [Puia sp.]